MGPVDRSLSDSLLDYWASRLLKIFRALEQLPELIGQTPHYAVNKARYEKALEFYQSANLCLQQARETSSFANITAQNRADFWQNIISAQVEIDFISFPDIDPNQGWLHHFSRTTAEGRTLPQIDTQLASVDFADDATGVISSFDYKPRKINFCHGLYSSFPSGILSANIKRLTQDRNLRSVLESTEPGNSSSSQFGKPPLLLKHTPGILALRFENTLAEGIEFCRDYSFKSGIGAHLPNATTGFQMDFWVHGNTENLSDHFLVLTSLICLQTNSPEIYSVRPLTGVGGSADEANLLERSCFIDNQGVAGGLHGFRLIDGINNLIIDFRFSKPISAFYATPTFNINDRTELKESELQNENFSGIAISVAIPLERITSIDRAYTLFLSIA